MKTIKNIAVAITIASSAFAADAITLPEPKSRSALIMIEFVNEWIGPDAKLEFLMKDTEQFNASQQGGIEVLEAARESGMVIIHATLRLSNDYRQFGEAAFGLRAAIPRAGTWKESEDGWHFAQGFEPLPNEFVIEGRTGASAFQGGNLESFLSAHDINQIFLAGYALHVCVESTLRDGHDRGYSVVVLPDASSAFTAEQREHVLKHVIHHFGAHISNGAFSEWLNKQKE